MLPKYRPIVYGLSSHMRLYIAAAFSLPLGSEVNLYEALKSRNVFTADVVMVLLSRTDPESRVAIEALTGVAVQRLPPRPVKPLPDLLNQHATPQEAGDARKVVFRVKHNPRLPTSPAFQRFQEVKLGRSVRQMLDRGFTRRDLREALEAGWLQLSEATA